MTSKQVGELRERTAATDPEAQKNKAWSDEFQILLRNTDCRVRIHGPISYHVLQTYKQNISIRFSVLRKQILT